MNSRKGSSRKSSVDKNLVPNPAHWRLVKLKHLVEICNGRDFEEVEAGQGYPVIGSGGEFAKASQYLYKGESVLLGRKGTINRPLYVNQSFWVVDTMFYTIMKPGTCAKFVYYATTTIPFDFYSTNTALPSMTQVDLAAIAFVVPSFEEQYCIARFLDRETDKIDALIAEQEKLIALLAEKRQAIISQAVSGRHQSNAKLVDSGVTWLGKIPRHWTVCALAYRYEIALGKMLDEKKISGEFLAPYLRNADVQWGSINVDDLPQMDFGGSDKVRFLLKENDLLVCEGGEVGRAAVWRSALPECFYQKALHRLRPRSVNDTTEYFFFVLNAAVALGAFSESGNKATIAHLPAEAFRRSRFAFPPREEQNSIVAFLKGKTAALDSLLLQVKKAVSLLKERRSALISAAVTGKIDVRDHIAAEEPATDVASIT